MHPVICKIGPFTIYSYGLMLALAFLVATSLASRQAKNQGFNPQIVSILSLRLLFFGIMGARIFYVVVHLNFYLKNPVEIFMLAHGGLSWFGGLLAGVLVTVRFIRKKALEPLKILDLIAPFLALAQAIGRIGCLLNGCCYGKAAEFGLYFPLYDAVLIPTQIYSSVCLLIIFVILRFMQERPHRQGHIFFVYLILYSVKRFFIEFLRADNEVIFMGLTLFQIISIILFFFAVFKLRQKERSHSFLT
jgi:phosphatidylglycerol:prolipoprotein diacylglycerol transferase